LASLEETTPPTSDAALIAASAQNENSADHGSVETGKNISAAINAQNARSMSDVVRNHAASNLNVQGRMSWADIVEAELDQNELADEILLRIQQVSQQLQSGEAARTIALPRNMSKLFPSLAMQFNIAASRLKLQIVNGVSDMSVVPQTASTYFSQDASSRNDQIRSWKESAMGKKMLAAVCTVDGIFEALLGGNNEKDLINKRSPFYVGRYLVISHLAIEAEHKIRKTPRVKARKILDMPDSGMNIVRKRIESIFPSCKVQCNEIMTAVMTLIKRACEIFTSSNNPESQRRVEDWIRQVTPRLVASPGSLLNAIGRHQKKEVTIEETDAMGKKVKVDKKLPFLVVPDIPLNRDLMIQDEVESVDWGRRVLNWNKVIQEYLDNHLDPCLTTYVEDLENFVNRAYSLGDNLKHTMKNRKQLIRSACLARVQDVEPAPKKKGEKAKKTIPQALWLEECANLRNKLSAARAEDELEDHIGDAVENEINVMAVDDVQKRPVDALRRDWILSYSKQ
jgi:hypothetical protein